MVPVKREVSCGPNVMSQYLMMEETGILVENALSQIDIYWYPDAVKWMKRGEVWLTWFPKECVSDFSQMVVTHPVFNHIQQGLCSVNRWERVSPLGASHTQVVYLVLSFYSQSRVLSSWSVSNWRDDHLRKPWVICYGSQAEILVINPSSTSFVKLHRLDVSPYQLYSRFCHPSVPIPPSSLPSNTHQNWLEQIVHTKWGSFPQCLNTK